MTRNEAVRAQIKVMMADGAGVRETDALVNAVVSLVLETMGVEPPEVGEDRAAPESWDRPGSTRELAALRAATVVERLEPLTAVAQAAERYRKAVRKGKGEKKARKGLFEALSAWEELQATSAQ
ncbi:MAG: hypothetical protein ACRDYE_01285 [Acidimicrobiales bacterium]